MRDPGLAPASLRHSTRVTPRDRRGVRLESGNHVQLGLAIIAVTVTA